MVIVSESDHEHIDKSKSCTTGSPSGLSLKTSVTSESFAIDFKVEDLPYEEELQRNPYSVKHWLRFIEHRKSSVKEETERGLPKEKRKYTVYDIHYLYERALLQMPMSYKLWSQYLRLRLDAMEGVCLASKEAESVNNTFERSLVFMHRMPRIWIMYCQFLMDQNKVTRTRKTFDRALGALPVTQHNRVWSLYLKFVMHHDIPETAVKVWRRYLKFCPDDTEDYINYLVAKDRLEEAAQRYEWCVNNESFASKYGKSKYQLWSELCDLISNNPQETSVKNAEAIIKHGLQRYLDHTGRLWNCLAQYYINSALFERARDVFEEAMQSVITVRDFTQVFDAYAQFEEVLLAKQVGEVQDRDQFEFRLARYEDLMGRRALLLNSVMLRQNPHNVIEWQNRISLLAGKPRQIVATYADAISTIDPKQAAGKLWQLWVDFAKFYENNGQLDDARNIFGKASEVAFVRVDDLASVWCAWAEMELRNDNDAEALQILKRATAIPGARIDYYDESETVQRRLHKSLKLWSLYADLEESLGTFATCKAVYERIIDLRIATPQIIINFGMFLLESNYFEEAFKAYERGIALFKWPYVYDIWNTYLCKFLDRYKGTKIERARDLFEQCLEKCPAQYSKSIYLLYAQMEEQHGLARHALKIYSRATKSVPPDQKLETYNVYLQRAHQMYGITRTRQIYQEAIEELPDDGAREMCLRFAETERVLGEIDRAREILVYCSQICDPRVTKQFWDTWSDFEVKHGNEDTMKELLRIKRSVQAKYNTQVNQMSAQLLSSAAAETAPLDRMKLLDAQAAQPPVAPDQPHGGAKILFVRGNTTARDDEVANAARVANPDEIDIDDDDDDEDIPEEKEIPREVFGGLK